MSSPTVRLVREDLERSLPGVQVRTIFEVGALVGDAVTGMARQHPGAEIWAFEPSESAYATLASQTASMPAVRSFQLALGARAQRAVISGREDSARRIIPAAAHGEDHEVDMVAGDAFCAEHDVERIQLLRIDTAGYELEVLRGFGGMLLRSAVDLVELPAGLIVDARRFVALERLRGLLEPLGYSIFAFYEQVAERRRPRLEHCHVIFVSGPVVEANSKTARRGSSVASPASA